MDDKPKVQGRIKAWRLEKRDATGEVFEIVTGGEGKPTVVEMSKPGQPASSYYQGT